MTKCSQIILFASDWLKQNKLPKNFEMIAEEHLADMLRSFYGTGLSKKGTEYSKSGFINL